MGGQYYDGSYRNSWRCDELNQQSAMLCYYGDDMEEYRRLCRWEDNTKMDNLSQTLTQTADSNPVYAAVLMTEHGQEVAHCVADWLQREATSLPA